MKKALEHTLYTEIHAEESGWKWRPSIRMLLVAGIICPIFYVVEFIINGLAHPTYNAIRQPISDLELVSSGWIQHVTFVIVGLLTIAFAYGLLQALRPVVGKGQATISCVLLVLAGCGWIMGGFFTEGVSGHPSALHDMLHIVGFHMAFDLLAVVLFVVGWKLRMQPHWRVYGWYSLSIGLLTVLLVFGPYFYHHGTWVAPSGGLLQRTMEVTALSWYIVMGCRLLFLRPAIVGPGNV